MPWSRLLRTWVYLTLTTFWMTIAITAGAPESQECSINLHLLMKTCSSFNLPLATKKLEGPSTCLTFLGIEVDTVRMELRFPSEKLHRLQSFLERWTKYKCCKKNDLESLVWSHLYQAPAHHCSAKSFIRLGPTLIYCGGTPSFNAGMMIESCMQEFQ